MDAGTHDATALAHRFERKRHELTGRSVDDRRVEQLRRQLVGSASQDGRESACKGLGGNTPRPSESEYRPPLPFCDLRHDMARCAKAIEPNRFTLPGHHQRAPPPPAPRREKTRAHE